MTQAPQLIKTEEIRPYDLVRAVGTPVRIPGGWPDERVQQEVQLELLHRPTPKPPVGAVLTGKQVKARAWKRGTKFCYIEHGDDSKVDQRLYRRFPLYSVIELSWCGSFVHVSTSADRADLILDDSKFVLVYRPAEESEKRESVVTLSDVSFPSFEVTGAALKGPHWPDGSCVECTFDASPELAGDQTGRTFTKSLGQWRDDDGIPWLLLDTDRFRLR